MNIELEPTWLTQLQSEFNQRYFQSLKQFLVNEITAGKTIYPHPSKIFNAFQHTPFNNVKVVILGQDPYFNPGQAMGLCFSVPQEIDTPPSLKNIYKELAATVPGFQIPNHGDLTKWADQGILMLNSILTVEAGQPASHAKKGWEQFTDAAITKLNDEREGIIFLLWGNYAKQKGSFIDRDKHHVLECGHPSPLSARFFHGCGHFAKVNELLKEMNKDVIDWQV